MRCGECCLIKAASWFCLDGVRSVDDRGECRDVAICVEKGMTYWFCSSCW